MAHPIRMRSPMPLAIFGALLATACSDGAELGPLVDGGPIDAATADASDAEGLDAGARDAAGRDAGVGDLGPFPCDPFAPGASPATPAALTGRIDVLDYDVFDDALDHARIRTRQAGFNFFTATMPVNPLSDGALFASVPADDCVAFDLAVPTTDLRPARNVGTSITAEDGAGTVVHLSRSSDDGVLRYELATQADTLLLFDRDRFRFASAWTWSTAGDPLAGIRAARAEVPPVEDLEVSPAFTSTTSPLVLDTTGKTFAWTAPTTTPGEVAIVLARALSQTGDAHYLVCRPIDDGTFTLTAAHLAAFAPTPDLPFDLALSRAGRAPFCNEGVTSGAAMHVIVYLGSAVVRP